MERPDFGQSKPFERRHAETKGDFVNVRLNEKERQELTELKQMLRLDTNSTALKFALRIAQNVLQCTFGKEMVKFIASPRRVRPGPR